MVMVKEGIGWWDLSCTIVCMYLVHSSTSWTCYDGKKETASSKVWVYGYIQHVLLLWSERERAHFLYYEERKFTKFVLILCCSSFYIYSFPHQCGKYNKVSFFLACFLSRQEGRKEWKKEGGWQLHMASFSRLTAYGIHPLQIASCFTLILFCSTRLVWCCEVYCILFYIISYHTWLTWLSIPISFHFFLKI